MVQRFWRIHTVKQLSFSPSHAPNRLLPSLQTIFFKPVYFWQHFRTPRKTRLKDLRAFQLTRRNKNGRIRIPVLGKCRFREACQRPKNGAILILSCRQNDDVICLLPKVLIGSNQPLHLEAIRHAHCFQPLNIWFL